MRSMLTKYFYLKGVQKCLYYWRSVLIWECDDARWIPFHMISSIRKFTCVILNLGAATYRKISNIRRISLGNKIIDHSDIVGASPAGAAPTTSSFST